LKLTAKQKKFADEYLIDLNATQSAIRAGYSVKTANEQGARLLAKVSVQAYIQLRMKDRSKRTEITQDRVLQELAAIGFAKATDVARVIRKRGTEPILDADGNEVGERAYEYQAVEIMDTDQVSDDTQIAIASIKRDKYGIEVKMHDKIKALELLGKHMGTFQENINLKLDATELTPEQAETLIRGFIQDA
jgi:phage terminase small subunit